MKTTATTCVIGGAEPPATAISIYFRPPPPPPSPQKNTTIPASEDELLSHAWYWDQRYSKSDGTTPSHEWFRSFSDLEPFLERNLLSTPGFTAQDNPVILHLGSGDSLTIRFADPLKVMPLEFSSRGYKRQLCVDFTSVVVHLMKERHAAIEGIEWRLMDVLDMEGLDDKSIHVAFDKAR
ncbi:hypothetical protein VTI74DRAFT_7643 [Chaetomium olivicolor]